MRGAGSRIGWRLAVEGTAPLRILGRTAYPLSAPSARVRLAGFAPFLRAHGVALEHAPTLTGAEYGTLGTDASALRKAAILGRSAARGLRTPEHDVLLVHRLASLTPDVPRKLDVYDLDDALFLGSAADVNRRFQWVKQEARRCTGYARRARLV